MSRFFKPLQALEDWQCLLADPVKHWQPGYSAMSLATCWFAAQGFPPEIRAAIDTDAELAGAELLVAMPEHQVDLPGGARPSQSDLWVLARTSSQLISIAIEGKVSEPFGPTVGEWLVDASPGKRERLAYLQRQLRLEGDVPVDIRYQLLHRTASAVIEARRFRADRAVMLVHSFSDSDTWIDDYGRFASVMGASTDPGRVFAAATRSEIPIHLGWVRGDRRFAMPEVASAPPPSK
jgi:hypothetical protein